MDYDNVDAKLSFHAKILNGQDTRPFHSSKQPGMAPVNFLRYEQITE